MKEVPIEKATAVLKASRGKEPLFTKASAFREALRILKK